METAANDEQLRLRVLADRSLLTRIAAFSSGVPFRVYKLLKQLQRSPNRLFLNWSQNGLLWQNAVLTNDRQTLEAFNKLFAYEQLRNELCALLRGLFGFAVAHSDDLALLDWIYTSFPDSDCRAIDHTHTQALVKRGDLEVIKWVYQRESRFMTWLTAGKAAAAAGHLAIVAFLFERKCTSFTSDAMDSAAANGHLEVARFLHEHRVTVCTERAMNNAATNGHLEVVRFLHEHRTEGCTSDAMDKAAANGHLDVVRFLHTNRTEGCTSDAMDKAAANGHLDVVRFLHTNRTEGCSYEAMVAVSANGHLDVLKFLHEQKGEWYIADTVKAAVRNGHLACVEYLPLEAVRFETLTMLAATHGHVDCIRYFHKRGDVKLSSKTLHQAAIANQLNVVKLLYEHCDTRCNAKTLLECDTRELHDVVAYLCSNAVVEHRDKALARAISLGRRQLVTVLSRPVVTSESLADW